MVSQHQRYPACFGSAGQRHFAIRFDVSQLLLQLGEGGRSLPALACIIFLVIEETLTRAANRQSVDFAFISKRIKIGEFVLDAQLLQNRGQIQQLAFLCINLGIRAAEQVKNLRRIAGGHFTAQLLFTVHIRIYTIQLKGETRHLLLHLADYILQNGQTLLLISTDLGMADRHFKRLCIRRLFCSRGIRCSRSAVSSCCFSVVTCIIVISPTSSQQRRSDKHQGQQHCYPFSHYG
ncbi:hypothetical protein D3C80_1275510 [compost metagenome]